MRFADLTKPGSLDSGECIDCISRCSRPGLCSAGMAPPPSGAPDKRHARLLTDSRSAWSILLCQPGPVPR